MTSTKTATRSNLIPIETILESTSKRYSEDYATDIEEMMVAVVRDNFAALADVRKRLDKTIRETMGIGELAGAWQVLMAAGKLIRTGEEDPTTVFAAELGYNMEFAELANVSFNEALVEIVTRVPTTITDIAERTALRISELYSEGRAVAFVHSAEQAVTERASKLIADAIAAGTSDIEAGRQIALGVNEIRVKSKAWTENYARVAFRTNLNTAVTAGRFQQVKDPAVAAVIPAFRFRAADPTARDNHYAANGVVLKVDNTEWTRIAPPLGYSCRCRVDLVTRPQLRRMGRLSPEGEVIESMVPSFAGPDEGFRPGPRPDLGI